MNTFGRGVKAAGGHTVAGFGGIMNWRDGAVNGSNVFYVGGSIR